MQTEQSGAQEIATDKPDFKSEAEQVSRRRRRLQLAVDAEYPYGQTNLALRRRLRLPTDKGMS